MTKLTGKILRTLIREEWTKLKEGSLFDDGKDERGLVKALQDWVNRWKSKLPTGDVHVYKREDKEDGSSNYMISTKPGVNGILYKETGEFISANEDPGVLGGPPPIIKVSPTRLVDWLSGTGTGPLAPNLPPAPTSKRITR